MLRGGMSELGRAYMKLVKEGKACGCMIHSGKLCKDCQEKEYERNKVKYRKETIQRIKNKIKK